MNSGINKENGAFFLRAIAREHFSEKKDDCFDLLNKAADEIERLQDRALELEGLQIRFCDAWLNGTDADIDGLALEMVRAAHQ